MHVAWRDFWKLSQTDRSKKTYGIVQLNRVFWFHLLHWRPWNTSWNQPVIDEPCSNWFILMDSCAVTCDEFCVILQGFNMVVWLRGKSPLLSLLCRRGCYVLDKGFLVTCKYACCIHVRDAFYHLPLDVQWNQKQHPRCVSTISSKPSGSVDYQVWASEEAHLQLVCAAAGHTLIEIYNMAVCTNSIPHVRTALPTKGVGDQAQG